MKKQAYTDIDTMYYEGKTQNEIIFKISKTYGFAKRFVSERIKCKINLL